VHPTALRAVGCYLDSRPQKDYYIQKPREGFLNWNDLIAQNLDKITMSSFGQYLKDTRAELRHVAWPTRTQTAVFTTLVVAISIFVSVYLGVFDYLFTGILERVVTANTGTSQTVTPPTASSTSSTSSLTITPISIPATTTKKQNK